MSRRPADEATAYELLEQARWGGGPPTSCPHCGTAGRSHFLRPAAAAGRRTRTGARTARRVWKCGACRRQFSVLVGTVLEGSRIELSIWIAVIADRAHGPVSASDVVERYGVNAEAARRMLRRLDLAAAYLANGELSSQAGSTAARD